MGEAPNVLYYVPRPAFYHIYVHRLRSWEPEIFISGGDVGECCTLCLVQLLITHLCTGFGPGLPRPLPQKEDLLQLPPVRRKLPPKVCIQPSELSVP